MGKQFGGPFANWTKKVGNVVAREVQGRTILSIYQPNVSNPRTNAQMAGRQKFSLLSKLGGTLSTALRAGFKTLDGYKTGTYFSAFLGYNYKKSPFTGSYPNIELNLGQVVIAEGNLMQAFNPSVTADSGTATFIWSDNSGQGNALGTDQACCAIYNKLKDVAVFDLGSTTRSDRTVNVTLPSAWNGDSCDVWFFMMDETRNLVSDSLHLGTITA